MDFFELMALLPIVMVVVCLVGVKLAKAMTR